MNPSPVVFFAALQRQRTSGCALYNGEKKTRPETHTGLVYAVWCLDVMYNAAEQIQTVVSNDSSAQSHAREV